MLKSKKQGQRYQDIMTGGLESFEKHFISILVSTKNIFKVLYSSSLITVSYWDKNVQFVMDNYILYLI